LALERRNCFTLTLTRDAGAALGCSLVCEACVRRLELGLMSAGDRQSIAHLKRSNTCVFAGRRFDEVGRAALGKCDRMLLRNTLSTRRLRRHLSLECGPLVVGSRKRSRLCRHIREEMDLLSAQLALSAHLIPVELAAQLDSVDLRLQLGRSFTLHHELVVEERALVLPLFV
jgi:hypothetical protein